MYYLISPSSLHLHLAGESGVFGDWKVSVCTIKRGCFNKKIQWKRGDLHMFLHFTIPTRGHPSFEDTPLLWGYPSLKTPLFWGHPSFDDTPLWGHPSFEDTLLLRTPLFWGHPLLRTPLFWGHLFMNHWKNFSKNLKTLIWCDIKLLTHHFAHTMQI